jgi:serine/threonine protein phosphatase PrpC
MAKLTTWSARSATGRVRKGNQDSAYAGQYLVAVADGMGGHVAGDVASLEAINALAAFDAETEPAELVQALSRGVATANAAIRQRGELEAGLRTMSTTLTAMLWSGRSYGIAHIGDSRAYRLRTGQLRQLTEDHAYRNLVSGAAAIEDLAPVMSRFLDGRPDRSPDLDTRQALPGDRYLLCSDGLTVVVPDTTIREELSAINSLAVIADRLVDLADAAGSPDNVTVIVIDVATGDAPLVPTPTVYLGSATQ